MQLTNILDRPIAFHRCLTQFGGVKAALFLSQALYWTHRLDPSRDGWFFKTAKEWEEETALTQYEQVTVRKQLVALGILTEKLEGLPATLWFRIDVSVLEAKLSKTPVKPSIGENPKLVIKKTQNKIPGNLKTISSTETTPEITTETTTHSAGERVMAPVRRDGIPIPKSVEEVVTIGDRFLLTRAECIRWYEDNKACGWTRGDGTPFDHWPVQLKIWAEKRRKYSTPPQRRRSPIESHPE